MKLINPVEDIDQAIEHIKAKGMPRPDVYHLEMTDNRHPVVEMFHLCDGLRKIHIANLDLKTKDLLIF